MSVHITSNVELRNYVRLLRNITSDCYLNIVVSLDCYRPLSRKRHCNRE